MKRRKFIIGTGAAAAGGASLLGSGAFTSVAADRSVKVEVVGDKDALLRLAPCTIDEEEQPNGDYVHGYSDGAIEIDLSGDNPNDPPAGSGVNNDAISKFHNVFEICNQGTQPVCVAFEVDIPEITGPVPNRYDFEEGDPAVVFYEGSNEEARLDVSSSDPNEGYPLDVGDCVCVGFTVRAFGETAETDLFSEADVSIVADAEANCTEIEEPIIEDLEIQVSQNGEPMGCVSAVKTEESVEEYYNYQDFASQNETLNEINEADEAGPKSTILIHEDGDDQRSLVFFHGSTNDDVASAVDMTLTNVPASSEWIVKDDDTTAEFASDTDNEPEWRWNAGYTDGGALRGGLDECPFGVEIEAVFDLDEVSRPPEDTPEKEIGTWYVYNPDGENIEVGKDEPITLSCCNFAPR